MTELSTTQLVAEIESAAATLRQKAAALSDDDVRGATELPGWTRGHVLAHLCGISNAMARQVEYAQRGETIELYDGGYEGRTKAIELAAGHPVVEHQADLDQALDRAIAAFRGLADADWQTPITFRGGVVYDGGLALWRELVIHLADLAVGRGPETWSRPFCEHLFSSLQARVPDGLRFKLQPLGMPPVTLGSGEQSVAISGMLTDIAAWLAGRTPSLGSLRATAAADGVDLPALLPWPSGVPASK